jgi:hypothetical protein
MNSLVNFLTSAAGRMIRIVAGLLLVWIGAYDGGGILLAVIGLIPIAAGVFNFCLLAPLFGSPLFPRKA